MQWRKYARLLSAPTRVIEGSAVLGVFERLIKPQGMFRSKGCGNETRIKPVPRYQW
jgi:hypothetical protein